MPRINSTFTSKVRNPGGATLLDYLSRRFDYHTREQWAHLLSLGRLELEGRPGRPEDPLREGQRLLFHVVDYDEPEVPLDFSILPNEEVNSDSRGGNPSGDLMFVHKPAGMPVHRTGKIFFQTLANLMKEKLGDVTWAPLNRLDRETSGIVAFARGPDAFRKYAPLNPETTWTKLYTAVVRGTLPEPGIGRIDLSLGEISGDVIRTRMHANPEGKRAVTLYQTLASQDGLSLVVLSPITGRKHQLRAHLSWAGCPVVGDKIYSGEGRAYLAQLDRELGEEDYAVLGARRHLLHSFHLDIGWAGTEGMAASDWGPGADFQWPGGLEAIRRWKASTEGRDFLSRVREG